MRSSNYLIIALVTSLFAAGCPAKEKKSDQVYFDDLHVPVGIKATVVSDLSFNRATGGESTLRVTVPPSIDRDQLNRLMKAFYRQVAERKDFKEGGVVKIDIRFYDDEAKAKTGGEDYLAAALRDTKVSEPKMENKQKLPLAKWTKKALGRMPQYVGKIKPRILADPDKLTVDVTLPFVKMDGTGQWAEKVSFARATTAFAGVIMSLFRNIEQLTQITYAGTLNDKPLIKVTLTREQAEKLELRVVQEGLGKFQGDLMQQYVSKKINDKKMTKLLTKQRRKVYKEVFKKMPEGALFLDKSLEKD